MAARAAPFQTENRIEIGGYSLFGPDMSDYDALLTSLGVAHTTAPPEYAAHLWDSGWMPEALATLYQDSLNLSVKSLSSSTSLTSSTDKSTFGQALTLTATVSSSFSDGATGTMTFSDGSRPLCNAVPVHGQATCTVSTLEPGVHSIVAAYSGDGRYLPSTSERRTERWGPVIEESDPDTLTTTSSFGTLAAPAWWTEPRPAR